MNWFHLGTLQSPLKGMTAVQRYIFQPPVDEILNFFGFTPDEIHYVGIDMIKTIVHAFPPDPKTIGRVFKLEIGTNNDLVYKEI